MSIRKRSWTTRQGEAREAWIVDYVDQHGRRHIKTFKRKKDADHYANQTGVEVRAGIHTAESQSIAVADACANWLKTIEKRERERSTLAQYQSHVKYHIGPVLGGLKLARLTTPGVHVFVDQLLDKEGMTPATARKVLTSLKSILNDARGAERCPAGAHRGRPPWPAPARTGPRYPDAGRDSPAARRR
jgi:integrase